MKKSLLALALTFTLTSVLSANEPDVLALVTNGKLNENSAGVKVLSLDEMKQVKGGYVLSDYKFSVTSNRTELYLIFDYGSAGETEFIANYYTANELGNNPLAKNISTFRGLCGINTQTCRNPSQRRMVDYLQITNQDYFAFRPTYIVTRTINYSNRGVPYVLFNYGMGVVDAKGQLYKFDSTTSSNLLKYNMVAKEIHNNYKTTAESTLGGWNAR